MAYKKKTEQERKKPGDMAGDYLPIVQDNPEAVRVYNDGAQVDVFASDLELYISEWCEISHVKDLTRESLNRWYAALEYAGRRCFPSRDSWRNMELYNTGAVMPTTAGRAWDVRRMAQAARLYWYLCNQYDKIATAFGFSIMCGVDLYDLKRAVLNHGDRDFYKKLFFYEEQSAAASLYSGKKNALGTIAVMNHRFGWNQPRQVEESDNNNVLTVAELPDLSGDSSGET